MNISTTVSFPDIKCSVQPNDKIAKTVAVIALLVIAGIRGITYSFVHDIPALRHLWAYPLCALINVLLLSLGLRAWRENITAAPVAMRRLLFLLLAWSGLLIFRSLDLTPEGIRNLFFTNWGAMSFLVPFLAICGLRAGFWPMFLKYASYFFTIGILYVGLQDLFLLGGPSFGNPFFDRSILFIAPLFYLSGFLHSKRYIVWGALGLLVWLLFEFYADKRENVVLIGWYFFCSLFLVSKSPVIFPRDKVRLVIIFGLCAICLSGLGFQTVYRAIATESFDRRATDLFIEGGVTRNTRVGTVEDFFQYMTLEDILFGRGACATYRTDISGLAQSHLVSSQRHGIEIGHLNHMLKGGIVLNVLFNSFAFGAVYLGLRRSRNRFTYILAFIILGWILLMLIAATPEGKPRYFLVWLAIGGCWSTELRSMSTGEFVRILCQSFGAQARTRMIEYSACPAGITELLHPKLLHGQPSDGWHQT